jgi:hypothetical protein
MIARVCALLMGMGFATSALAEEPARSCAALADMITSHRGEEWDAIRQTLPLEGHRWIALPPDALMSMDYAPERLVIVLDKDKRIASTHCG